jgi:hypothetical protein
LRTNRRTYGQQMGALSFRLAYGLRERGDYARSFHAYLIHFVHYNKWHALKVLLRLGFLSFSRILAAVCPRRSSIPTSFSLTGYPLA